MKAKSLIILLMTGMLGFTQTADSGHSETKIRKIEEESEKVIS